VQRLQESAGETASPALSPLWLERLASAFAAECEPGALSVHLDDGGCRVRGYRGLDAGDWPNAVALRGPSARPLPERLTRQFGTLQLSLWVVARPDTRRVAVGQAKVLRRCDIGVEVSGPIGPRACATLSSPDRLLASQPLHDGRTDLIGVGAGCYRMCVAEGRFVMARVDIDIAIAEDVL
jgi:hypothetical protein